MKTKTLKRRLVLNMETIVNLTKTEISGAHGGIDLPPQTSELGFTYCGQICWRYSEDPDACKLTDTV
jgi:hypothetical protein